MACLNSPYQYYTIFKLIVESGKSLERRVPASINPHNDVRVGNGLEMTSNKIYGNYLFFTLIAKDLHVVYGHISHTNS